MTFAINSKTFRSLSLSNQTLQLSNSQIKSEPPTPSILTILHPRWIFSPFRMCHTLRFLCIGCSKEITSKIVHTEPCKYTRCHHTEKCPRLDCGQVGPETFARTWTSPCADCKAEVKVGDVRRMGKLNRMP